MLVLGVQAFQTLVFRHKCVLWRSLDFPKICCAASTILYYPPAWGVFSRMCLYLKHGSRVPSVYPPSSLGGGGSPPVGIFGPTFGLLEIIEPRLLLEGETPLEVVWEEKCASANAQVLHYMPSLGISYGRAGHPLGGGM